MKLVFYTSFLKAYPGSGHPSSHTRHAKVAGDLNNPHLKYLCGWLVFDVDTVKGCSIMLEQIGELERGARDLVYGGGNAWFVTMYRDHVDFEFQTANDHPDWPIWKCSLEEVKAALIGWRQFLEMPKQLDSVLEVELPQHQ